MLTRSFFAVLFVIFSGCATASKAVKTNPASAQKLRSIRPSSPENAVILVYRNTAFGSVFGPVSFSGTVFLDESPVGDVQDETYAVIEVAPGRHSVRIIGTAGGITMQTSTVATVAAAQVQFLQLDSQQGMTSYNMKLNQISAPNYEEIANDCHESFTLNLTNSAPTSRR